MRPHTARDTAESFGNDAERYDRARPSYPAELIEQVVALSPGRRVLDVGCGTGIEARQFVTAGCSVLGVEPDVRMAGSARSPGVEVEIATFEDWDPAGRTFDAVVAGQSWHWVDPAAGSARAAQVLPPGGVLAVFGHVFEPPRPVADAFADAYARVVPASPFGPQQGRRPLELYRTMYDRFAEELTACGEFAEPEQWQFDWRLEYTRDEWLDLLPTTGGLTRLGADQLAGIQDAVGRAVDALGGTFTMEYVTLAAVAVRR